MASTNVPSPGMMLPLDPTAQKAANESRPNPAELIRFPEEFLKIYFSLNQPCQSWLQSQNFRDRVAFEIAEPLPF